jgi:UDP-N-acetylglucosamine acyltransferase
MNSSTTNTKISPSAKVSPTAVIGEDVIIGDNTEIREYAIIRNGTKIGSNCKIYPHVVIGEDPQDFSFTGEKSFVEIGDNNTIREFVSVHRAVGEGEKTIIGDNNFLMAYTHLAHNSIIKNNVIIANNTQIGGHSVIEDNAVLSANVAIHQNCRVGRGIIMSGMSATNQDIVPFFMYEGIPAIAIGLNRVGLKRLEVAQEVRNELHKAFKIIFKSKLALQNIISELEKLEAHDEIKEIIEFLKNSKRGIKRMRGENLWQS